VSKNILLLCACASLIASTWAQKPTTAPAGSSCGPINGQAFKCPKFGFSYEIPLGWVDRTAEMQQPAATEAPAQGLDGGQSQTLLAIFERPPQAVGQTINSAVIIAAESRADYPQVKTAADYFAVISDLAEAGGLKAAGDPYAFTASGKQLVREDFAGEHGKLPIFQSTLVILEKGKIVSFTFIARSEDDVAGLIDNLRFATSAHPIPGRK
jgi:hypothetical protein